MLMVIDVGDDGYNDDTIMMTAVVSIVDDGHDDSMVEGWLTYNEYVLIPVWWGGSSRCTVMRVAA